MSSLLIEPCPISDIYCDGIAHVENLGHCFRTVYFTWSRGVGRPERLVVAKIVRPISSIIGTSSIGKMVQAEPILGMVSINAVLTDTKRGH